LLRAETLLDFSAEPDPPLLFESFVLRRFHFVFFLKIALWGLYFPSNDATTMQIVKSKHCTIWNVFEQKIEQKFSAPEALAAAC
jgi:hypothetical protein